MRRLLLAALAAALLLPGTAAAMTFTVEGGAVVVRPDGTERLRTKLVAVVPGPCGYPTRPSDSLDGAPTGTLDDPAGCVTFLAMTGPETTYAFGPGCAEIAVASAPMHLPLANFACGLSGATRIDVRGSDQGDRVEFDQAFATTLPVSVATGAGDDEIDARDQGVETLDCGAGEGDTAEEDPADRSTGCEGGTSVPENGGGSAGGGTVAKRGETVVVDLAGRRRKTNVALSVRPEGRTNRTGLKDTPLPAGLIVRADPLPALGAGCIPEKSGALPHTVCGFPARAFDVIGPARHPLHLESFMDDAPGPIAMTVRGGASGDWLEVADGHAQRITACGAGHDRVEVDGQDEVAGDCEDVRVASGSPRIARPRLGTVAGGTAVDGEIRGRMSQSARIRVRCPASATTGCGGYIEGEYAKGRVPFGSSPYWIPAGRTTAVDVVAGVGTGRFGAVPERRVKALFYRSAREGLTVRIRLRVHRTGTWRTVRLGTLRKVGRRG